MYLNLWLGNHENVIVLIPSILVSFYCKSEVSSETFQSLAIDRADSTASDL